MAFYIIMKKRLDVPDSSVLGIVQITMIYNFFLKMWEQFDGDIERSQITRHKKEAYSLIVPEDCEKVQYDIHEFTVTHHHRETR